MWVGAGVYRLVSLFVHKICVDRMYRVEDVSSWMMVRGVCVHGFSLLAQRFVRSLVLCTRMRDFGLVVTRAPDNDALSMTNPLGDQGLRVKWGLGVRVRVRVKVTHLVSIGVVDRISALGLASTSADMVRSLPNVGKEREV